MAEKKSTKLPETKAYFKLHFVDGVICDFEKRCNGVNYDNGIMVTFLHTNKDETSIVLAIVPVNQIRAIEKVDE